MRTLIILAGSVIVTFSAYAGELMLLQASSAQSETTKIVVAAVDVKQVQKAPVRPAAALTSKSSPKADQTDSRLNDYRLERESCCGPQ
jgi:hypothetical protein